MYKSLIRPVPFYGAMVFFLVGGLLSFVFLQKSYQKFRPAVAEKMSVQGPVCEVISTRLGGYEFVRPLLYVDKACESPDLIGIKAEIEKTIADYNKSGLVTSVSVFVRDFDHSNWISINDEGAYHPGSLYKIPVMFAWLHQADKDPALMHKKFLFEGVKNRSLPVQNYLPERTLKIGQSYTLTELLERMIVYSDNLSQWVLFDNLPKSAIEQALIDLGIGSPLPSTDENQILITAHSFSNFMKALVNGSYLSLEHSEYALSLLAKCDFKEGFVKGLPEGTKIAHKFGEVNDQKNFELHEMSVIYIKKRPYLLTVLSKGTDGKVLPGLLGAISHTMYEQISKLNKQEPL